MSVSGQDWTRHPSAIAVALTESLAINLLLLFRREGYSFCCRCRKDYLRDGQRSSIDVEGRGRRGTRTRRCRAPQLRAALPERRSPISSDPVLRARGPPSASADEVLILPWLDTLRRRHKANTPVSPG